MFNKNPKVDKKIVEMSKEMGITLTKDEHEAILTTVSMIAMFSKNEKETIGLIRNALKSVKPSRQMEELLEKGIEIEYTDGTKQVLKKK